MFQENLHTKKLNFLGPKSFAVINERSTEPPLPDDHLSARFLQDG